MCSGPARTVTGVTTFTLPSGFALSARGEYQGGFFGYSGLDALAVVSGGRWPACFNAYPALDANNLGAVTALVRARCIRSGTPTNGFPMFPLDFFRLRDITLRRAFPIRVGAATSAVVSVSGQNVIWWRKVTDSALDAEASGGMNELIRTVGVGVPIPRTFVASIRLTY
ncbi:MAG: hypothetical protein NVS4B3_12850 [Gemmatimonadaceae bacterium]